MTIFSKKNSKILQWFKYNFQEDLSISLQWTNERKKSLSKLFQQTKKFLHKCRLRDQKENRWFMFLFSSTKFTFHQKKENYLNFNLLNAFSVDFHNILIPSSSIIIVCHHHHYFYRLNLMMMMMMMIKMSPLIIHSFIHIIIIDYKMKVKWTLQMRNCNKNYKNISRKQC